LGEEKWQACVVLYYSESGRLRYGVPSFSTGKEKGGKSEGREEEGEGWGVLVLLLLWSWNEIRVSNL